MPDQNGAARPQRATDLTLSEQLQITDREIEYRKDLLGITHDDVAVLRSLKNDIAEGVDEIVERFYDKQLETSEISLLIGDAETLERLRQSLRRYIIEMFEGYYDGEYVNKRLRIGKVHKRIGVSPKLYVSAVMMLQTILDDYLLSLTVHSTDHDCDFCEMKRKAVHKILMFDMQLVFDTFISSLVNEVEAAKADLEDYAASLEETIAQRTRQLKDIAVRDGLTGLLNQRAFFENLRRELSVAERSRHPLSLVYFDLNGFKKLNDGKGHKAGDELLESVGKAIMGSIRDVDFGCRYGGDEFCIIMPNATKEQAKDASQRLIGVYDAMNTLGVTFSIGIADTGPENFLDTDALVKRADKLMYKAKAKSKTKPGHYVEI